MTVYISGIDDVVERLDLDLDTDDTTKNLQSLKAALEDDIETIEELIDGLRDFIVEARDRVSEIEYVLDEREAAATESNESGSVQTETVG
jgi:hypothetical protein